MFDYKRVTLLCGHYGSGKTNVAVNMAQDLRSRHERVTIADLDIVNPYFRTKDSAAELERAGIRLICSEFAGSNLDIPSLPADLYAITDDREGYAVLDIGGDDRGAYVLGRLAPGLLKENNYEMLMVINGYRPLTPDAASTVEVMREIEQAAGIAFTGLINNSHLGRETTPQTVLDSRQYADDVAKATGLPLRLTTVNRTLYASLRDQIPDLFPLCLQQNLL